MEFEIVGGKRNIARIRSETVLITDVSSALDLMVTARYETKCDRIIVDKSAVTEDFFKLSTCLAGEVLQKYINYSVKLAIVGDYSQYKSKPLKDFMRESNAGRDFFFVGIDEEAIEKLS